MNEEHTLKLIKDLHIKGQLNFSNVKKALKSRELETFSHLFACLNYLIEKDLYLDVLLPLLELIEETILQFGNSYSLVFYNDIKNIYEILYQKLSNKNNINYNRETLDIFRKARTSIKRYLSKAKNELTKDFTSKDVKIFDYLWRIIKEVKNTVFIRDLIRKYSNFSNAYDANYHHLSYRIIREYLTTNDDYYLSLIPIIFEVPNLKFTTDEKDKIFRLIQKYETEKTKFAVLKNILTHYLGEEGLPLEIRNGFTEIKLEPQEASSQSISPKARVDLTHLWTFGIRKDNSSIPFKFGIDPYYVYSVEEDETGYILYMHIPDMTFIKNNSEEEKRASHLIDSLYSQNEFISLFPEKFLFNDVSFREDIVRPAITFKMPISTLGVIKTIECLESLIRVDKYYGRKSIESRITNNSENEVTKLNRIARVLQNSYPTSKANSFYMVTEYFSQILEYVITTISNKPLPLIYRNIISSGENPSKIDIKKIQAITLEVWNKQKAASIMSIEKERKEEVIIYSYGPLTKPSFLTSTPPITNPEISYIAIQNLRTIKKYLAKEESSTREEELQSLSLIANACNKSLFLTRNNKCYLRKR